MVKVLGTACGLGIEGSGWVAGDGLVVTNAHVVAGERDTRVLLGGREPGRPAQAVHFDPRNDLAILRVDGLDARPLPLAEDISSGTSAAILGFPLNGPFDVRAGRLGPTRRVRSSNAYGRGPVERSMTALRGLVRSGNSGGPMVDGEGRVVTTIFAATTQRRARRLRGPEPGRLAGARDGRRARLDRSLRRAERRARPPRRATSPAPRAGRSRRRPRRRAPDRRRRRAARSAERARCRRT